MFGPLCRSCLWRRAHIGKAFLRLSLVSCPIQLFPATSEREKVSFNQINKETGSRIRYRKVDEDTGEEVPAENITKGFEIAKGKYVEIDQDELDTIALESTRTIEIDEFVPKSEIDDLYNIRPYYIAPDGKVGQDAFVVIRDIIAKMDMVAIGRVVLTSREHIIAMQPRGKGIMGTLLRYPYEIRDENEYFDDISNVKISKDMMDLARHIVETKSGHFKPEKFEDQYEAALKSLIEQKSKGIKIEAPREQTPAKVINLMDALRRSVKEERRTRPQAAGQALKKAYRRSEGNAVFDRRQEGRQRRKQEVSFGPPAQSGLTILSSAIARCVSFSVRPIAPGGLQRLVRAMTESVTGRRVVEAPVPTSRSGQVVLVGLGQAVLRALVEAAHESPRWARSVQRHVSSVEADGCGLREYAAAPHSGVWGRQLPASRT